MATAWLFPGQGSQQRAMRERVAALRPDLLDAAIEVVGCDPFDALDRGTAYQQPAIYCASLANLRAIAEPEPDWYAGHSLGEITALAASGALSELDGLRLVALRASLLQQVNEAARGEMLAIAASVEEARALATAHRVTLAVDNAQRQAVLSGNSDAIAQAQRDARAKGLRAWRLAIDVAAHTPALAGAAERLRAAMWETDLRPPRRPCLSCVTAEEFDDVPMRLAESLTRPTRWREVLLALRARGVDRFLDVGPGAALSRLVRSTLGDDVEVLAVHELTVAHA